jgi:hypothetical protein
VHSSCVALAHGREACLHNLESGPVHESDVIICTDIFGLSAIFLCMEMGGITDENIVKKETFTILEVTCQPKYCNTI